MKIWLDMLISCQMGGRSIEGRIPKPKYDHVYEVEVQHFEPELQSNTFQMSGSHRMVVTSNDVKFFPVGSNKAICFLISSIRGCSIVKANRKLFKLEIGRSSESGSGVLVMKCNDEEISDTIRETMYSGMRAIENNATSSTRHRGARTTINSNNIRIRTHSWSNVDKRSGAGSLASSVSSTTSTSAAKTIHHGRQHSATAGFMDHRYRTTSEGNSHFEIKRSLRGNGGKSITSGSPMSPGSFVSSESAGSSNSLDETDGPDSRLIITPSEEHPGGPATIFEESSAESCVEQYGGGASTPSTICFKNPAPSESRLADSNLISNNSAIITPNTTMTPASAAVTSNSIATDINVNYTPIDILPSTSGFTITGTPSSLIASSPPGTSVHYSTILMDEAAVAAAVANPGGCVTSPLEVATSDHPTSASKDDNAYMIMSPHGGHSVTSASMTSIAHQDNNKKGYSSNELNLLKNQHKPLTGLIADHDFEAGGSGFDTSASSVTSPNSQSSYNPLLDEVQTDDSSAYVIMSPSTSAASGASSRMSTAPRKISHQRSGSNSLLKTSLPINATTNTASTSEDYVDMSPASRSGFPIPNRNERTTPVGSAGGLGFGTSPSAALTSHLVSYGDLGIHRNKTPSSEDPYLIMSPVDPEKNQEGFANRRSTPPIKQRTASIDSGGSSSLMRPKSGGSSTRGRFCRGQSDSQRSSLCFDDHWDHLGISPQESSGGTLMGPPSESDLNEVQTLGEYAPPIELSRTSTISKAHLDSLQPVAAISRLRLDHEEPLELDVDEEEDVSSRIGVNANKSLLTNPRAYSVGCRPQSFLTGSSSSVSTTGSGSSHHHHNSRNKSRYIDIPGASTSGTSGTGTGSHSSSISPGAALLTGQSPSSMAARFGSWIRHRTGSVPSKSAISGRRRHRTQSEGEKDEI